MLMHAYAASIPFDSYSLLNQDGLTVSWLLGALYIIVSSVNARFKLSRSAVVMLAPLMGMGPCFLYQALLIVIL